MSVTQSKNIVSGDVVAGDKIQNINVGQSAPLARLYKILRDANQDSPYTAQISDQLQHYCAATISVDVRGLAEKLTAGNRPDLIEEASNWKERAAKLIMKWQTSPVAQDIITHVLAKLHTEFTLNVRPAIQALKSREEVDALVSDKVIAPTLSMLGDNDLGITHLDLVGLVFFLGGNCHIRWDKC